MTHIETLISWGTALTAVVTVIVTAWVRLAPVLREAITLLRAAADAVGVHDDGAPLAARVDAIGQRLDRQADRLTILEVRVEQLDCQDGPGVAPPPTGRS